MKIKVKDLAGKVDTVLSENGTLYDFEIEEDEAGDVVKIQNDHDIYAVLDAEDEIEWDEKGKIHVEGSFFYTGNFVRCTPESEQ